MGVFMTIVRLPRDIVLSLRMSNVSALAFLTSWFCWTVASMQFYLLPYSMAEIAKSLGVPQSSISEANTTSLLTRSIGAAIFGIVADQFGRKISILVNLVLLGVFTLCSGFVHTSGQFVGVRLLFGIAFGGLYGPNMAAVLEAVPREARGAVGGVTQQGFAAGNMLASAFRLAMDKYGWRPLYYLGAGLVVPAFALRFITPSHSLIDEVLEETRVAGGEGSSSVVGGKLPFLVKFKYAVLQHWPILIYTVILTACYNTLGHGHMDIYPSFLLTQKGLGVLEETWVTIILQSGGVLGGLIGGHLSKYSVKWVPFCFAVLMAPFIPLWILPNSWHLLALGAFFLEFCYGSAIGALGNILQMVCPHPGIRAAFGGVAYNLGNAISSFAPTVETKLGEEVPLPNGTPDYGRTQMILVGIMIGLLCLVLACMPTKSMDMEWDVQDPDKMIPSRGWTIEGQESSLKHLEKACQDDNKASQCTNEETLYVEHSGTSRDAV
ncbi:major facilitator superfamily domain-containing protein [Biscogniauxia mediterranea]|nr:major facilitator superfamily domain-containing protein [Biscogniauxia mediterranea]